MFITFQYALIKKILNFTSYKLRFDRTNCGLLVCVDSG
jgi:hypothetical protein